MDRRNPSYNEEVIEAMIKTQVREFSKKLNVTNKQAEWSYKMDP